MASKNTIRVKIGFEKDFLCACLQCGITPRRANVSDPKFSFFAIEVQYYQAIFELGYSFCKLTGQRLF